jgi:hypothetical protein
LDGIADDAAPGHCPGTGVAVRVGVGPTVVAVAVRVAVRVAVGTTVVDVCVGVAVRVGVNVRVSVAVRVGVAPPPLAVTEPSLTVRISVRLAKVVAAAMAEYSRLRALVPAPTTLNVMMIAVILPVAPLELAPLKMICPVPTLEVLTLPVKPVGGCPE